MICETVEKLFSIRSRSKSAWQWIGLRIDRPACAMLKAVQRSFLNTMDALLGIFIITPLFSFAEAH